MSKKYNTPNKILSKIRAELLNLKEFPNVAVISRLEGMPDKKTLSKILKEYKNDLKDIQKRWIEKSRNEDFLKAISNENIKLKDYMIIKSRGEKLGKIIKKRMGTKKNKGTCPSVKAVSGVLDLSEKALKNILGEVYFEKIQKEWIEGAGEKDFLKAVSNRNIKSKDYMIIKSREEKLSKIIKKRMGTKKNKGTCPSVKAVSGVLDLSEKALKNILGEVYFEKIQKEWIEGAGEKDFLKAVSNNNIPLNNKIITESKIEILKEIIERKIKEHENVFPNVNAISGFLNLARSALRSTINKEFFEDIQIRWLNETKDENFIEAISSKHLTKDSGRIGEAKMRRFVKLLTETIKNNDKIESIRGLSNKINMSYHTIKKYLPDEVYSVLSTKRTLDQEIVSKIETMVNERDPMFDVLIEKRLKQLSFFRELVALAKLKMVNDATVVSFTHETLPNQLEEIVPGINIKHMFLDELISDNKNEHDKKIESKIVVLLSVVPWIGKEKINKIFKELYKRTSPETKVIYTYPYHTILNPEAGEYLENIGFKPIEIATFGIIPIVGSDKYVKEKLQQTSNLAIVKKFQRSSEHNGKDFEEIPELLIRVNGNENGNYEITKTPEARTYTSEELKKVKSHMIKIKIANGTIPTINKESDVSIVDFDFSIESISDYAALLEFSNSAVAGYNMDYKEADIIEIDHPKGESYIPVSDIMLRMLHGRDISNKFVEGQEKSEEMKMKYKEFMNKVSGRRNNINPKRIKRRTFKTRR